MVAETWELGAGAEGRLRRWVHEAVEAQAGRGFLWSPVALAFGIWIYFWLAREPGWLLTGAWAVLAAAVLWAGRARPLVLLAGLLLAGFVLAKVRSEIVATPVLRASTAEVTLNGVVEDAAMSSANRIAIILAVDKIDGLSAEATPLRLRLTGTARLGLPAIGSRVVAKARLAPLPTPVMPGGFDYGRQLWFDSIGGTGRITGGIEVLATDVPARLKLTAMVETVRQEIGKSIRRHLGGVNASFAEALITGERSTIPKEVNQSLLTSGLYHILSISGLHMWLVAGGVFWIVRALLAAVPVLALRHPIKKWAAAAGLVVGYFYMLLAQSGVATQRSYIMVAVVFFAVIADRPAISVRNLALAAMVILGLEPEAATEASFQMSFLAVMGLAAYFEFWVERRRLAERVVRQVGGRVGEAARALATALVVSVMTSLIAGALSSIPAAYHFGRLAPYGVIANALALPVISFIVMPMALISTLLIPFGLAGWPLWVMGQGLDLVMAISNWVAGFPGAHVVVAQQSAVSTILLAAGSAALCLLAGPIRLIGVGIIALGLVMSRGAAGPDILIESTASNAAIRNGQGELVPALARKGRFAVEKWLLANGDEAVPAEAAKRVGWNCTGGRCLASMKGKAVAFVQETPGVRLDCGGVDILIANYPLRGACRSVAIRIDRFDVWRNGSHGIRIDGGMVTIETSRGVAGARPWVVAPEARRDKFKAGIKSN